jgi:hypothetical protein
LYHEFGQSEVIREFKVKEIPMDQLMYLIRFRYGNDVSKLTDMNFLGQIISDEYVTIVETDSLKIKSV